MMEISLLKSEKQKKVQVTLGKMKYGAFFCSYLQVLLLSIGTMLYIGT